MGCMLLAAVAHSFVKNPPTPVMFFARASPVINCAFQLGLEMGVLLIIKLRVQRKETADLRELWRQTLQLLVL